MRLKAFITSCMLAASCAPGPGNEASPQFAQTVAADDRFRSGEFVAAGLRPIEMLAASGREVRRLMLRGHLPGQPPIIEVERLKDGSVSLTLWERSKSPRTHKLPGSAWNELVALDAGVFERPKPLPPLPPGWTPPGTSCHGAVAYFEGAVRGKVKSAGAMDCVRALSPFNEARRRAVVLFARLALSTQPSCPAEAGDQPDWALLRCFSQAG